MFEFLLDAGNYDLRKVARTNLDCGLIISTAYTSDEGYETAIIDGDEVHPVERYETKELAEVGHDKWCKIAPKKRIVNKLGGLSGLVDDKLISLKKIIKDS